jgi:DNA ligase (NAD+)
MNIDGLSDAILSKFIDEGMIESYKDIYNLFRYEDKIVSFEGFGLKSYNNLISSIDKSRNVKLANFIYSLGIKEIGLSRAKLICKEHSNNFDKIRNLTEEELSGIEGIGEVIAKEWVDAFSNEKFIKELDGLLEEVNFVDVNDNNESKLEGKTFVITGSLEQFKNRDELVEFIENMGGKVVGSISKKTDYLINNDINSTSTKNNKAKELGVEIIDEIKLLEMVK